MRRPSATRSQQPPKKLKKRVRFREEHDVTHPIKRIPQSYLSACFYTGEEVRLAQMAEMDALHDYRASNNGKDIDEASSFALQAGLTWRGLEEWRDKKPARKSRKAHVRLVQSVWKRHVERGRIDYEEIRFVSKAQSRQDRYSARARGQMDAKLAGNDKKTTTRRSFSDSLAALRLSLMMSSSSNNNNNTATPISVRRSSKTDPRVLRRNSSASTASTASSRSSASSVSSKSSSKGRVVPRRNHSASRGRVRSSHLIQQKTTRR